MLPVWDKPYSKENKLSRYIALLITTFILILSASVLAAEPGSGIIEGSVVNGTKDGSSVANQDIILKTYLNDNEIGSTATKTDAAGKFQFSGLSAGPGYSYQVSLQYQEAEYISERITFDKGKTTKSVTLTVYDSTTSDGAIKVTFSHIIIYVGQGSFSVMEYFLFVNEGDRTYVGSKVVGADGKKETLRFSLPKKATELQYTLELMECCVVQTEEGFVDTMPVKPGAIEASFSYRLSYSSGTYTFSKKVNHPIDNFDLLVQSKGIEVVSDQLTTEEPLDIEGNRFIHLSSKNLAPGVILSARLSGLPKADIQRVLIWVAMGLTVLIVGFGFSYPLIRKRLQPVSPEGSLDHKRQGLLLKIAQLDNDFESGKISEEVYRRIRTETKAQLVELMRRLKEKSGDSNRR